MILASYGNVALMLAASNSVLYKAHHHFWRAILIPYSWFFLRYLNSASGRFSVFSRFYFHEWVCQKLSNAMGSSFFRGVKFYE